MRWLLVFAIAAVFGSISCAENYNNFGGKLQRGNFNSLYNQFQNFGSIQQPSGHWHYGDDEEEADNSEEDTTYLLDDDEESDPDQAVDSNDPNLEDDEIPDDTDQDFGLDEVQSDSRQKSGLDDLSSLPTSKSQLESSTVDKKSEGTIDNPTIDSSVSETDSAFNDSTEENSSNQGFFEEGFGNDNSQLRSQTQSGDISNLFGGLLGSGILSSGLKNNLVQSLGGISQNGGESKLNGDLSSLIAGILGSSIPKSTLSNGVSKIGNIRNSVLDFRDRALDQRVGIAQRGELNQFDPRFQALLSNPSNRGSTGVDQLTWNSLRNLINNSQQSSPAVQQNNQGTKSVKNGVFGLLGSVKGAYTANKGSGESINNSGTKKDEDSNQSVKSRLLGLLGNAVSNKETHNENNRGGRFRFLSDAKNFVVNPVDFLERKIRNKIKQKIKNEIKQSVDDVTKRVDNFKSNMTSLASGLAESFQTKPSIKRSRNCLKILTGPQAHHLYLNGKQIPKARIFYVDKLQPLDFNSCPINHQDEVLKNCLLKGNVLVLSQPDRVKVEEEHGRQLEMIIAKDVVKDRLNSMVDTFFQNFGRQFLKGMHIFRGDKNE